MNVEFNPQASKIGEILIHINKLSESQLQEALLVQKKTKNKLGVVLVKNGFITEDDLVTVYSMQLGYRKADDELLLNIDPKIASTIPEEFARQNAVLVLEKSNSSIKVAMEDPEDITCIDALQRLTGLVPDVLVVGPNTLERALDEVYGEIKKSGEVKEVFEGITVISGDDEKKEEVDLSPENASQEDAPIVKLVNMILQEAIKERATDIHIEPQEKNVIVRIRIDGVLQTIMTPPNTSLSGLVTRIKILSKLNIAEKRLPQDGRFTIKTTEKEIDVRVSILPTIYGEKIVMRLLDKTGFAFNLKSLGLDKDLIQIFQNVITRPYGLIIVSGPTGSGKSTTLYASLKEIKNDLINITTVEDPVEYHLDGINQVQVFEHIGLTFGASLKFILRQDPDILLIGEIRDQETADIAVKFSLTGHLVFSTLHANDAVSTITRFLDLGVPPFLVGACVNLVMAQRLVRKICPHCREEYDPSDEELKLVGLSRKRLNGKKLHQAKGCRECRNTGYLGRTGIFELIPMTRKVRALIYDSANEDEMRSCALAEGMVTLRESGLRKILDASTTIQEVLRITMDDI
ncbi:MAG TPA: ATPase, T2SS/T4P/T4SS family [Candidatus Marinimicrobia bacterium]|jgi:type IV pilus assembly protein PilB|nr:ATPase, T2SS/T4P/T4SS family [Candidatus Neomarinimicrobiota bacterium]MDP6261084.1 ATPase, T2SS/T4P/T4SS family [Candidatus Neomarinimicrobiota bacterium]MDP7128431.1 ATPase, T2SS/T4P/T4SS family [Candidatus Neomarinimicrobiota bacterium]MDP7336891.1 ATPase, T2SS/T4P/T4SS family [Candidatus Neomarinimicrobiota bacterium]MDP7474510.1 ATPase, T2SS/T4P/T4SS family [Candidatus Neomarinimicrobiota bacterium]|tara:strand:- start:3679 stop:5403 length:1725 start_codon:yes stop_codon:yes gene_type:complete